MGEVRASQVMLVVKSLSANAGDIRDLGSIPGSGRSLKEGMAIHSSILPGEFHGQRNLVGSQKSQTQLSD